MLFDYCRYPAVVDTIKDLIGVPTSNLTAMHTMLINKPPDTGEHSNFAFLGNENNYHDNAKQAVRRLITKSKSNFLKKRISHMQAR